MPFFLITSHLSFIMMGYSPKSFEAVRNRQPLPTALAALAITQLVVRYEGGGDSGCL